ncbi:MAG TPA: hypothetical protein VGP76_03820 [Planctomycetaceae bacterium]|jgi:hypothetical protein|nr:hypothetical protein [Planctomycetaceae bacterium]
MASVAIVSSVPPVLAARNRLRKTTLLGAWLWGAVALGAWAVTFFVTEVLGVVSPGVADQMWLASAVLLVCPLIAVLGARRPGSRVWGLFIVAPLAVVLDLPAVTAWNRDFHPAPLRLEVPMLAGYGLVLLMGAGNYLGTRFALPALLAAAAMLLVPVSMSSLHWLPESFPARATATLLLGIAVWMAAIAMRKGARWGGSLTPSSSPMDFGELSRAGEGEARTATRFDRLWNDFRDLYGIVWARRVMDRVNDAAVHEGWPVRLHRHGFAGLDPTHPPSLAPDQFQQIERTLRWLLRRFVDPEWIGERIAQRWT